MTAETTFQPTWRRPGLIRRWGRRLGRCIPFVVWAGAAGGALLLLGHQQRRTAFSGLAETGRHTVSTLTPGRLSGLVVRELDNVEPGQLLASLDDEDLRLRLARARAELERLKAELSREETLYRLGRRDIVSDRQSEHVADRRRFLRDRESAALDVLDLKASIEEDRIRAQGLAIEMERLRPLVEQGLSPESEWTRLETEHDALAERVRQSGIVLAERESFLRAAQDRLAQFEAERPAPDDDLEEVLLAPMRWSIQAQNIELESIAFARTRLQLHSPVGGHVEEIRTRPGQVLAAGDVLLTIVEKAPRAIVAFVPETEIASVKPGMKATIEADSSPGMITTTTVSAIGPASRLVPTRFWLDPRVEEWALPVYLDPTPDGFAMPGEALRVRIVDTLYDAGH